MTLRHWLATRPCVINGKVRVDVRGVWPVAIIGLIATTIRSQEEFVAFIAENLEVTKQRRSESK